jgi:hypothetical protein
MAKTKPEAPAETKQTVETPEKAAARETLLASAMDRVDMQLDRSKALERFQRDAMGLLTKVNYLFKEDGTVDWKLMIPSKYIVVNTEYFERRQIAVPDSAEGLEDKQCLVLLGGIKELAKIRGILKVEKQVVESNFDRAVVLCRITFAPNYETDMQPFVYEEVANATLSNTNQFSQLFLETIASNRAFVRAVRNALRIDIVGSDELSTIPTHNNSEGTSESEPWHALRDAAKNAVTESFPEGFKTFDEFKGFLQSKSMPVLKDDGTEWADWSDIPAPTIFKLISSLKKATAKAKSK